MCAMCIEMHWFRISERLHQIALAGAKTMDIALSLYLLLVAQTGFLLRQVTYKF